MNTSRFFSALIVATLTFGISGGTADAAPGHVTRSSRGFDACVVKGVGFGYCPDQPHISGWTQHDYDTLMTASSSSLVAVCNADGTCSINGVAGSIDTVWETADAKSDLTAFDDTSEADSSDWADDEYEDDYSDSEWDEEDTESESESCDDEEAEAELGGGECISDADCGPLGKCVSTGTCLFSVID